MSFVKLEGNTAIIVQGGVYKQADLYSWKNGLFLATAGGFVRIKDDNSTTKDKLNVVDLFYDKPLYVSKFGRLEINATEQNTPRKGR